MHKQQDYKYPSSCSNKEHVPNNLSFHEIGYCYIYYTPIINDNFFIIQFFISFYLIYVYCVINS